MARVTVDSMLAGRSPTLGRGSLEAFLVASPASILAVGFLHMVYEAVMIALI